MKRTALLALALPWLGLAGMAQAASEELRGYVAGEYEYVNPDSRRAAEQGQGFRALYGFPVVDYATLELSGRYTHDNLKFGAPSCSGSTCTDNMFALGADLAISPWRGPVAPFMLLGIGGVRDSIGGGSETSFYADAGAGVWVRVYNGFFFRGEVRRAAVFGGPVEKGKMLNDTHVALGVQYMWFKEAARAAPVRHAMPVTPPPVDLCKIDSDHDGVPDCRDKCPDTPPGFKVDANGCIEEKQTVVMLSRVLFSLNSADLKPEAKQQLDQIVAGLKAQPGVTLEVGGHTCNIGTEQYNIALSKRRAESVRDYLVQQGVDAARLSSEGYGEFSPIASNDTEEGRQQNRRVEFRILSK
jgi:outer membrane protein OmpA-like peptidoglycan-associated protein